MNLNVNTKKILEQFQNLGKTNFLNQQNTPVKGPYGSEVIYMNLKYLMEKSLYQHLINQAIGKSITHISIQKLKAR